MMDPVARDKALRRLKIAKGQLEGVERMIREGKYCVDVLTQVSAVHEALRGVGKLVVRNHLETCVTEGVKKGKKEDRHYDELMDIIYKLSK